MRRLDKQRLGLCARAQFILLARRCSKHSIDEGAAGLSGELYCFVNCCVLRCLEIKKLIKADPQQIAKIDIDRRRPETIDPEIQYA
jgi:hypothetical protein